MATCTVDTLQMIPLSTVPQPTVYLVSGFIRQIGVANIPSSIDHLCLTFYYFTMAFDRQHHGPSLAFIDDHCVKNEDKWNICVYGPSVSAKHCDIFTLHFESMLPGISMGYIIDGDVEIEKAITNWKVPLGASTNKEHSVSFLAHWSFGFWFALSKHAVGIARNFTPPVRYQREQRHAFIMSFDFQSDSWSIHCDGVEQTANAADTIRSLHGTKTLLPAFSIYGEGELKITKYEFKRA